MALLLSGREDGELIEITTPYFDFYLKGELKDLASTKVTKEDLAVYSVSCADEIEVNIFNVCETKTRQLYKECVPQFFEQTNYQVIIEAKEGKKVSFDHDNLRIREKVGPVGRGKLLTGVINFHNEIGLTELRVLVDDKVYLRLTLEIYPSKLGYKTDYLKLRQDVASEVYNLTFDFMRKTYLNAGLVKSESPSLTEFYSILEQKFEELNQALNLIIQQPYHELQVVEEIKNYRGNAYIGPKGIQYLNKHPQQIQRVGNRYVPKKFLHIQKQMTTDVYENQFIKHMLQQIIRRIKQVEKSYKTLHRATDEILVKRFNGFINELEDKLEYSFLKDVSSLSKVQQFSIVMHMSPIYKQFYKIYLSLQMGLSIWSGLFQISNKNIAELYEYWCFIKLGAILKEKHELINTKKSGYYMDGLSVTLKKGEQSIMSFKHRATGEVFTLAYNKVNKTPTLPQKPDNILSLKRQSIDKSYQYVIDAKYKMDYRSEEIIKEGIKQTVMIEAPREEDINTMHRYRDAIVYKNSLDEYEHSVVGAIILFPGSQSEVYRQNQFYKSISTVNIGALPFLPSNTSLVEEFLEGLVDSIDQSIYHRARKYYEVTPLYGNIISKED